MKILGIDPSDIKASFVLWDTQKGIKEYAHNEDFKVVINKEGKKEKIYDLGHAHCISVDDMCMYIINKMHLKHIDLIAIETIESRGMPLGKTTLNTMYNVGRFVQTINMVNMDFEENKIKKTPHMLIKRREEQILMCGNTKAKDSNITQYLIDKFGKKGTKKEPGYTYGISKDNWQAFGVAVTAYIKMQDAYR